MLHEDPAKADASMLVAAYGSIKARLMLTTGKPANIQLEIPSPKRIKMISTLADCFQ